MVQDTFRHKCPNNLSDWWKHAVTRIPCCTAGLCPLKSWRTSFLKCSARTRAPASWLRWAMTLLTLSLLSSKSTSSQPFKDKVYEWGSENWCIIIFYLSKLWKSKLFILRDVMILMRLQGKFDIDHSEEWRRERGLVWIHLSQMVLGTSPGGGKDTFVSVVSDSRLSTSPEIVANVLG